MCLTSCEGTLDDIFGEWSRPTGNNGNTKTTVAVKSVMLDQTTLKKAVGDDAVTLTATVDPSDASDKTVTWKSSDANIAAVDANGKVTFEAAGTATITATATNGTDDTADDKTAECAVTVIAVATSLTLNKTMEVLVKNGDALTITATVTPTDATDKTVTWESSDEAVATVANGVVTPKGVGIATITAKSGDVKATCEVFVGNEVALSAAAYEAKNYDILKGNMGANSLTIPDGFKVALDGLTITNNQIVCSGDATIYLIDGKTNTVSAAADEAGIKIGGEGTTLTINAETEGDGTLDVTGGYYAAGIGTGKSYDNNVTGGDITINGGVINATGGDRAAGIGTGYSCDFSELSSTSNQCGDITINGGTVKAICGNNAAGIGTGLSQSYSKTVSQTCGDITIATGVTSVTAQRNGTGSTYLIGKGNASGGGTQKCGKIKFGTAEVFDGASPGTWDTMTDGNTYGGLTLAKSLSTWTLTPVAP